MQKFYQHPNDCPYQKILSLDTEEVDKNSYNLLSFTLKIDYVFLKQI